jgi:hypothetical protein
MDYCLDDFINLKLLVEEEQGVKVTIKSSTNNSSNINIQPVVDNEDESIFLKITFRVDGNKLVLSWLYLLDQGKGTGTKLINWFIKYCEHKKLNRLYIVNVQDDKVGMLRLCKKLGFIRRNENQDYQDFSDYYLEIK